MYGHIPTDGADDVNNSALRTSHVVNMEIPIYMFSPMITADSDSPMSKTIVGFLSLARERIALGWNVEKILGPVHFDVSRLLGVCEGYNPDYDEFSVPGWATSVMLTYTGLNILSRLSALLRFSRLMRVCSTSGLVRAVLMIVRQWLVVPSAANYALLAEGYRPTPTQLLVPHIPEYDFLMLYEALLPQIDRPTLTPATAQ